MEMDANYSSSDPFENGRLFCVSEDIETLDAEVYFQMDGERDIMEMKDRNADEALWSNTWDGNVSGDTVTVSLNNLQEEKEYVVRFTETKINHAVVKVTFESGKPIWRLLKLNCLKRNQEPQNKKASRNQSQVPGRFYGN